MHHRTFNVSGGPGTPGHGLGGHGKPGSPNTAATHHHHSGGGSLAFRQTGVYDGKIAGLYDLEETLGRGHFAVVKLARHVFTGEKVAVKVIDKSKLDEVSKAHLFQEVRCMKLVQHPNVVRLYEVIDTATKLYLILELGDGGDLYDYIMRHDAGLSEQVARDYFKQIVRAITYCHQLHVVHRDLKPENVVFFQKLGVVKLTDFGFSNKFCPGQKLETSCGSLAYSAPEILLGDSYDAPAVDVWSLGVILYMLVCGQAPFQEANDSETLTMIMDCKYTIPEHISKDCKDLIARMLVRTPEKRATLNEISTHPWLGSGKKETLGPEIFPLVSREQLIEEDHNLIVQKIVNGNIASKEEIQECLDKNEYNHITATYYLLAERKLRAKRQEAANTKGKRPENLLVTQKNLSVSRDNSLNQQPCLLTVPRTPGDVPQRTRKCSIVQEDEEEEDMTSSGREELTGGHGSLNRRGSRSEGRLNLALQERLIEERFKRTEECKKSPKLLSSATTTVLDRPRTSQVTPPKLIITANQQPQSLTTHTTKHRLGKSVSIPESQLDLEHLEIIQKQQAEQEVLSRNNSTATTKVLTEAATVSIPLGTKSNGQGTAGGEGIGRSWRTMPAPASPGRMGSREGASDAMTVGKSDILLTTDTISEEETSTSTPTHQPTPTTRPRTYISNNRTATANNPHQHASASSRAAYEQRRAKFHTKHRTASCSSSDASDDDSEGRKKRSSVGGVKGVNGDGVQGSGGAGEMLIMLEGIAKPLQGRRDSHDDSSDSQEPGTGTSAASIRNTSSTNNNSRETNNKTSNTNGNSSGGGNTSSSGGRKNTNGTNTILGRRHKASRRRSGETTRLRESQSLNRITEVQEDTSTTTTTASKPPPSQPDSQPASQLIISTQLSATQGAHLAPKVKGLGVRLLQAAGLNMAATVGLNISGACVDAGCRRTNSVQQIRDEVVGGMTGSISSPGEVGRDADGKGAGHCSRRDGCAYRNSDNGMFADGREVTTFDPSPTYLPLNPPAATLKSTGTHSNNCNTFSNNTNSAGTPTSTSKKLRLGHLGKYLQLHKRFFIPLPAFLTGNKSSQKSQQTATSGNASPRLYKAQSCGSLTHNRVQIQRDTEGRASADVAAITLRPRAVSVVRCYCDINQNDNNAASGGAGKLAAAMLVNEMCVHLGQASKCSFC